jgi:hypothetical protein
MVKSKGCRCNVGSFPAKVMDAVKLNELRVPALC